MADLIDTNVLVYRFDHRDPRKQEIAGRILRSGIENDSARLPHQAVIEFVAAVTKPLGKNPPLLGTHHAMREAEDLLAQFDVLYPNEAVLRTALRGAVAYQLSWFDAHLWAYAETFGLQRILSEDFQHQRLYGGVEAWNPFAD